MPSFPPSPAAGPEQPSARFSPMVTASNPTGQPQGFALDGTNSTNGAPLSRKATREHGKPKRTRRSSVNGGHPDAEEFMASSQNLENSTASLGNTTSSLGNSTASLEDSIPLLQRSIPSIPFLGNSGSSLENSTTSQETPALRRNHKNRGKDSNAGSPYSSETEEDLTQAGILTRAAKGGMLNRFGAMDFRPKRLLTESTASLDSDGPLMMKPSPGRNGGLGRKKSKELIQSDQPPSDVAQSSGTGTPPNGLSPKPSRRELRRKRSSTKSTESLNAAFTQQPNKSKSSLMQHSNGSEFSLLHNNASTSTLGDDMYDGKSIFRTGANTPAGIGSTWDLTSLRNPSSTSLASTKTGRRGHSRRGTGAGLLGSQASLPAVPAH